MAALTQACSSDADASGSGPETVSTDRPIIVATTSIWADVVGAIACDGIADIQTLMPPGSDPHAFEPSLADRRDMENAALLVSNGLGLEAGLEDTIGAVEDAGTPVLRLGDHADTIAYSTAERHDDDQHDEGDDHEDHDDGHEDHDDADDDHGHGSIDPHIWLDPTRVSALRTELVDQFVGQVGLDAETVRACSNRFGDELQELDADLADLVATVPQQRRLLVTNHDALGYFADRYGFDVVDTVIPAPSGLAESNPAQLEDLATLIRRLEVPAIFAETQHTADDAGALAARLDDVEVVTLFTGTLDQPGGRADSYTDMLRVNAELIVMALR